jgi:hypothetical protein
LTSTSLGLDPSFQEQLRTAAFDLLNRYATQLDCLKVHFSPFNENALSLSLSILIGMTLFHMLHSFLY